MSGVFGDEAGLASQGENLGGLHEFPVSDEDRADYEAQLVERQRRAYVERDQALRTAATQLAVQFSAAPGKGGNIHQMLEWADEINAYLVDGSLKGKEA